jgi:hypothetical protein
VQPHLDALELAIRQALDDTGADARHSPREPASTWGRGQM